MKMLVVAADALIPDYIFGQKQLFPNISGLIDKGASAEYSAFVQRGYNGSYTSSQNWASIYTGLLPHSHKINIKRIDGEYIHPSMSEFDGLHHIWKVLNGEGYTIGMFQPSCCIAPVPLDGYCLTSAYAPIFTPSENRASKRSLQLNSKDAWIRKCLDEDPPPRIYPKSLNQLGYTFEQLKGNPDLADEMYGKYDFAEVIDNFNDELAYWRKSIQKVYDKKPVDILWFYTPSTDIIPHFVLHEDNCHALIKCYTLLDDFIGELINEYDPEYVIVMSDHGQANFKDLVNCSDQNVQREAFSKADDALWLNNGYIAFEAQNGGLLLTTHSLKGVFIVSGPNIRNVTINDMRTLDIYPTLLELLNIKIPKHREGYAIDIFNKTVVNSDMVLNSERILKKSIALVQCHSVSITDIIINELYLENRFVKITLAGDSRYEEIFKNNPRLYDFVDIGCFEIVNYDEVYCGFFNEATNQMWHSRVK